jgi:hypothetical protein
MAYDTAAEVTADGEALTCELDLQIANLPSRMDFMFVPAIPRLRENQACPGLQSAVDGSLEKVVDKWLAAQKLPAGAAEAIRPAALAWFESGAQNPAAENEMIQTLLLWLAANRPQVASTRSTNRADPLQQYEIDRLRREVNDLQRCLDFDFGC